MVSSSSQFSCRLWIIMDYLPWKVTFGAKTKSFWRRLQVLPRIWCKYWSCFINLHGVSSSIGPQTVQKHQAFTTMDASQLEQHFWFCRIHFFLPNEGNVPVAKNFGLSDQRSYDTSLHPYPDVRKKNINELQSACLYHRIFAFLGLQPIKLNFLNVICNVDILIPEVLRENNMALNMIFGLRLTSRTNFLKCL